MSPSQSFRLVWEVENGFERQSVATEKAEEDQQRYSNLAAESESVHGLE